MKNKTYLRHIHACNPKVTERFIPWLINDQIVGWLRPPVAQACAEYADIFQLINEHLHLNSDVDDNFAARTEAIAQVTDKLTSDGVITPLMGEVYPVTPAGREQALCTIDRAAGAFFGIRAFGQHLNAYVRVAGELQMWIARRALDRLIFPGALDNMVAGGLPHGISLQENLLKEAWEEAALPAELAVNARPVSVVTYNRVAKRGFRPDILYCYDLELSEGFVPQNTDGEVAEFMLLPIQEVVRLVRETDEFKLNCNLVIIDFLLRHGYITPDHPDYIELATGLCQPPRAPIA